jgi:hypothetical protein
VLGAGIDDQIPFLARAAERRLQHLDLIGRNAGIVARIEPEQRHADTRRDVDRPAVEELVAGGEVAAIPGDARARPGSLGRIDDRVAPAAAEAGHADAREIAAIAAREGDRGVDVRDQLVDRLAHDDRHDLGLEIGGAVQLALAEIVIGRHGQIAGLGEAPADVLDPFVEAEHLHHHDDDGKPGSGRGGGLGAIAAHRAAGGRDRDVAGDQARGVGADHRLRLHGACGQRVAGQRGRADETAPAERLDGREKRLR